MTLSYVLRRVGIFFGIIWLTATINFVIVHVAPGNPTAAMLGRMSSQGQMVSNGGELIRHYEATFGLNEPLIVQYFKYLGALAQLNLGYSISSFPTRVSSIIGTALPWTLGLLLVSSLVAFVIGTVLGALLAWRATPSAARVLLPGFMVLGALPSYLMALLLLFVLGFTFHVFPVSGTVGLGEVTSSWSVGVVLNVLYHSILPGLALVLTSIGGWMLGMRAMTVSVLGSDFLLLAEAKGLRQRRIFVRYAMRNAILPQVTVFAISLGFVVSGQVLVEYIFNYPGLGSALYTAISNSDYPVILGIEFILVVAIATCILVLDLVYPRLDPRITYRRQR